MSPQRAAKKSASQKADTSDDGRTPVGELGYEQARDELAEVVATLERGGLDLDASLALWERGEALADRCEAHLAGARERIEAVLNDGEDLDDEESDDEELDEDD
ncbi:exodeoxyribonuclease VII small subunit [Gordonia sp. L191]|uniref:exodeoxyribonuclease VII small subunit n=1 Tax=Gordonia sp. L191 TaxID=2982699 RepID=UPI0024BFFB2F|nr:exodeoxyribonuclease VII small subunit [Gordonia sp. L191]WHU45461.1 exodeoxyribonuclease VII small subunit [Gordonia sp. L191]